MPASLKIIWKLLPTSRTLRTRTSARRAGGQSPAPETTRGRPLGRAGAPSGLETSAETVTPQAKAAGDCGHCDASEPRP